MSGVHERLAGLPPERLRLLERLASAGARVTAPLPDNALIDAEGFGSTAETSRDPRQVQRFYRAVSLQLDASPFAEHARFLNYGYVPNDNEQHARARPTAGEVNRNAIRLILELIGDADIQGAADVLDVGSGRGGTAAVLQEHFAPVRVVGVDLVPAAAAFSRRTRPAASVHFLAGDAQSLPFPAARFDWVTNVESSHCYPRVDDFFREVHRVLRPGGGFLYTDLIAHDDVEPREALLEQLGFRREHARDITSNVLLSCDDGAARHARAFRRENDPSMIESFLGVPSSALYEAMKDGRQRYLLYRWRKHVPHGGSVGE
jgi:SAM-dependent methyltransferase